MIKYFHIIKFLMTHDLTKLKDYWESDFIRNKKFTWIRVITRLSKKRKANFYFWWRLANEMHMKGNKKQSSVAHSINDALIFKYNTDIMLGAKIGINLQLEHHHNIVINNNVEIGDNCFIMHNVTIGQNNSPINIKIGNNFRIYTGSTIIGGVITIGDNVTIGAMTFINKDIPDNCTVYTEKTNKIIYKAH